MIINTRNKGDTIDKFIKSCRKNNFFIPNISGEINEDLMGGGFIKYGNYFIKGWMKNIKLN